MTAKVVLPETELGNDCYRVNTIHKNLLHKSKKKWDESNEELSRRDQKCKIGVSFHH